MSTVLQFVRVFPGLTTSVALAIVMLPVVLELIDFVLRLQAAIGR